MTVYKFNKFDMNRNCFNCGVVLSNRYKIKFCSNTCQHAYQYKMFIEEWLAGRAQGEVGKSTRFLSRHIRRYLIEKNGDKCSLCGWNKIHSITGLVPLEVDHIDGNSGNNKKSNLRLLCPNCHSLTEFYKSLNKGKGRKWRMVKYKKEDRAK